MITSSFFIIYLPLSTEITPNVCENLLHVILKQLHVIKILFSIKLYTHFVILQRKALSTNVIKCCSSTFLLMIPDDSPLIAFVTH